MERGGEVFDRFYQDLLLFHVPLPQAFTVAVEIDAKHFQLEFVAFRYEQLSLARIYVRGIGVEHLHLEFEIPGLAGFEPGLGFVHRVVCSYGECALRCEEQCQKEGRKMFECGHGCPFGEILNLCKFTK